MSVVELPDIRMSSNKTQTRSKKSEMDKYRKLAVTKSVDKLVRKNDLQSVIGYDNDYYPKQLEDQKVDSIHNRKKMDETVEVHANLTELKKSCDNLRLTGMTREKEIDKMRKEIDSITLQCEQYNDQQKGLQGQEGSLKQKCEEQQRLLSDSLYMRKVYEHMLQRMKKDQLVYQLRANEYERELSHSQQSLNSNTYKYQQIKELYQKTKVALKEVADGIKQQNKNREKNLERFKEDLKHRQGIEQKREERIKRQQEIAEVAANDIKDSSLKKWRKLLLVHKFLNSFLKNKMQRGLQLYAKLEMAFQKIKASTGVTDANEIVQKFLGREQTYAHLLISISDQEKKIQFLKQESTDLKHDLQILKQKYIDMDKEPQSEDAKKELEARQNQEKLLLESEEKATNSGLLDNKFNNWMKRNLKKLGLSEEQEFSHIVDALKEKLLALTEAQQVDLLNKSIIGAAKDIYETEFQRRNVRVKPKKTPQQLSNSSYHNDSLSREDEEFEEIAIKEDDVEDEDEEMLMRQLRDEVKQKAKK